jgi:hypothetical protein
MTRLGLFKYVPAAKVDDHQRRGWLSVAYMPGPVHGFYSILMWHCECGEAQP